jgi:hypothetical protein
MFWVSSRSRSRKWRLVALNAERKAEEDSGTIRWLRPDYQQPSFGEK